MCQRQAKILLQGKSQLDAAGCKLAFVSNGTVEAATKFVKELPYNGELYLDPTGSTYKALGFKKFSLPKMLARIFKSLSAIKNITKSEKAHDMKGDGNQTGGIVVIGPGVGAQPAFTYVEGDHAMDHMCTFEEILPHAAA